MSPDDDPTRDLSAPDLKEGARRDLEVAEEGDDVTRLQTLESLHERLSSALEEDEDQAGPS